MANTKDVFRKWLNEKLRELGTDETVFGSYILSILEDDEDASEDVKLEALDEIFSEITVRKKINLVRKTFNFQW